MKFCGKSLLFQGEEQEVVQAPRVLEAAEEFTGAVVMGFEVSDKSQESQAQMSLTIGGRCVFTQECLEEFTESMQTREQQEELGLPVQREFDWPDVKALQLCPCCAKTIEPDDTQEYYLVWQFATTIKIEKAREAKVGLGCLPRLMCKDPCVFSLMATVAERIPLADGSSVSMQECFEEYMPPFALLDFATNSLANDVPEQITAWKLDEYWHCSGAYNALEDYYKGYFQAMGLSRPVDRGVVEEGYSCACCNKTMLAKEIRLCARCKITTYCGRDCQKRDWKEHKKYCVKSAEELIAKNKDLKSGQECLE